MNLTKQISLDNLLYVLVLSSKYILKELLKEFHTIDKNRLKELLFIELRRANPTLPDYVYKNTLQNIKNVTHIKDIILLSLDQISSEFIEWKKGNIYIKNNKFEEWQNTLTFIPPLEIISYFFFKNRIKKEILLDYFNERYSTLPSPYLPEIEHELKGNLIELHIHLNGTSETEHIWIDALGNPYDFLKELEKSYSNKQVIELYNQFDIDFRPSHLYKLLKLARVIREFLVVKFKNLKKQESLEKDLKNLLLYFPISSFSKIPLVKSNYPYPYKKHPYEKFIKAENPLIYEATFLYDLYNFIQNNKSFYLQRLFYLYLLLKSVLNRLLVQQLDQYGFDQFQKITLSEIREYSEQDYKIRFLQLNSLYKEQLKHLEGRFAPKSDWKKLKNLVDKIIKDYEVLKGNDNKKSTKNENSSKNTEIRYSLSLVAHFIKKEDKRKPEKILTYRHYELRQELKKQAINLWNLIKSNPKKYLKYIRGIDAAANELHAPPEVFAPSFRFLRRRLRDLPYFSHKDIDHNLGITFHAGEDFIHIVSGIRYIYEAITFLKMAQGDRIGHATAIGIDPEFWINKVGEKLKIKKGEWLDNLVFSYMLLRENPDYSHYLYKIEKQIEKYFKEIYSNKIDNLEVLIESYLCRTLDPEVIRKKDKFFIYRIDKEELNFEKILGFEPKEESISLFKNYHTGKYIKHYNEIIEINTAEPINIEIMEFLQQHLVKLINNKGIAIETMPTSNIRISFYEEYKEHHIYRWLNEFEEPPTLLVCSDDPGIFSTTLKNEYYAILDNVSKEKRIPLIKDFLKNSEIYVF